MRHFDLVIIGSGSGNSLPDERFANLDIALVEQGTFGGTCLNVGCIPTKMYVFPADLAKSTEQASRLGVDATVDKIRWADIRDRVFGRIDPISAGGRRYRAEGSPNVTLYTGHATFIGPRRFRIALTDGGVEEISADRVVLAAGSRPMIPSVVADSGVPYFTSDNVMRIDQLPERMTILGGGYIGAEFAHVFDAFGVDVTWVTRGERLLRHLDQSVCERFTEVARERWTVHTNATIADVCTVDSCVRIALTDGTSVDADVLMVATGRVPNGDRMHLEAGQVATEADGRVTVDEFQRTSAEGVFALGDVSSPYQLKHVANHEAKVVAHNLLHPDQLMKADHRFVPSAVFTYPQIAQVGMTEAECREHGVRYASVVQEYSSVAYGWAMEDTTGFCKLLADPSTGQLLGAHVLGAQASTVIQPLIQAMSFGLSARDMARGQYWIHPALPELVENALLSLPLD